ncbi:DUF485 domain-containing protein [Rufibacter glacialis]|uniref:DUF485 domain-containing protein n=1 Tax=Rufibacter glacialis TaxID=1259555 RepID=A0A5M8QHZ0_9BACT|nr:DUF485 domain-containing protein [Rufibacter glacialis]KAA6435655.1 DUF485 domain-containing protein [Rufibacter glacialis]GGK65310.1 hypothetical protein GCM10011405_11670 [Rufibacter glacialis]
MNQPLQTPHEILESPDFKRLVKKRWSVSLVLTCTMLIVYFGFLLLVAFNKQVLATRIGEYTTLAIPIGLGIILFAWVLTGIYVFWANNHYDTAVENLKNKIS